MPTFASRAGAKLQFAIEQLQINVKNKTCADLGASTGGFTDCLLQNGAVKVFAVEKGYGTLEWKLRQDPRVVVMEKTSALEVELPEKVDFISIDVGWTRQHFIIPKALSLLKDDGQIVSLLKPHYEAEKKHLKKGKVAPEFLAEIVEKVKNEIEAGGAQVIKIIESPIVGGKGGNVEYLLLVEKKK
jgi:23S rRNA (cytidine1920-2'-O)/16S rRNA (cytidine1409-2'-O)-methyltransferase